MVVVPARDEAATVAACVASVRAAARWATADVEVRGRRPVLRRDRGTCAGRGGPRPADAAGCVGAARAAGVAAALAETAPRRVVAVLDRLHGCRLRRPGGVVAPPRGGGRRGHRPAAGDGPAPRPHGANAAWLRRYAAGRDHVHGANLGVRASVYRRPGVSPPVPAHEDRLLVDRVRALPGVRVTSSWAYPVLTSDRTQGRTPAGVAHDLGSRLAGARDLRVTARAVTPRCGETVVALQGRGEPPGLASRPGGRRASTVLGFPAGRGGGAGRVCVTGRHHLRPR